MQFWLAHESGLVDALSYLQFWFDKALLRIIRNVFAEMSCVLLKLWVDALVVNETFIEYRPILEPQERHHETRRGAQLKKSCCREKNYKKRASGLRDALLRPGVFKKPSAVFRCIGMYWPYFSYPRECIGMYRNVLALLFIPPRMTRYIPKHSNTSFSTKKNNQYFMSKIINI